MKNYLNALLKLKTVQIKNNKNIENNLKPIKTLAFYRIQRIKMFSKQKFEKNLILHKITSVACWKNQSLPILFAHI